MAKDPAFLFYPGDYLRDTQCLSSNVQVAYDRIMCEHMRNICISQQQLNFFTKRLTEDEKQELLMVLKEEDSCYCIEWVSESIVKRRAYSDSRRKNRKGKTNKISKTYVNHMENENENENEDLNATKKEKYPFDDFWKLYDKKIDRPKCESKWNRLKIKEREEIMTHVPKYKISQPDKQFRKNPMTYLNSKSWENEIITTTSQSYRDKNNNLNETEQLSLEGVEIIE